MASAKNKNTTASKVLALVLARLDIMDDGQCAVASEHKKAMRLYLDTWVVHPLELLRRYEAGEISASDLMDLMGGSLS